MREFAGNTTDSPIPSNIRMHSNAEKVVVNAVENVATDQRKKPAAYTQRTSMRSTSQPAPINDTE